MSAIKVIIIDDNLSIRRIVKELLTMEKDIVFCGEAESGHSGRVLLSEVEPDVAIIDISLDQDGGGFKVLEGIKAANLSTKVIMFSAHSEDVYADKSFKAGAKGYLCKDKTVGCLIDAIRCVHSGQEYSSANR